MSDPAPICLRITATPVEVRTALTGLMTRPDLTGDSDFRQRLEIVLAEILNNIAEHAYPAAPGRIGLCLSPGATGMTCQVTDYGLPMPGLAAPAGHPPPMTEANLPEGGFGWFLIRSLCAGLTYRHRNGQNNLTLIVPWHQ